MATTDTEALSKMLDDITPAVRNLTEAMRTLGSIHGDLPEADELRELWSIAHKVTRAAVVEHARLIGMDVTVHEQRLNDMGSAPWRDLVDSGSDSDTAGRPPVASTNDSVETAAKPQVHLLIGEDSHVYVAVPLALTPTQLTTTMKGV